MDKNRPVKNQIDANTDSIDSIPLDISRGGTGEKQSTRDPSIAAAEEEHSSSPSVPLLLLRASLAA